MLAFFSSVMKPLSPEVPCGGRKCFSRLHHNADHIHVHSGGLILSKLTTVPLKPLKCMGSIFNSNIFQTKVDNGVGLQGLTALVKPPLSPPQSSPPWVVFQRYIMTPVRTLLVKLSLPCSSFPEDLPPELILSKSRLMYPLTLQDYCGTMVDFSTILSHLVLSSTALDVLTKTIPVHSSILFSHLINIVFPPLVLSTYSVYLFFLHLLSEYSYW